MSRHLRLRDLFVFSLVAEHASMAKAAQELGVAQPSVSEVISNLEHAYGARLFDRSPRGVQLTVYGQALLKRSATVFDEIDQSARDIQFLADPTVGEVRIAALEGLSAAILPEMIQHFAHGYPKVVVYVDNLVTSGPGMNGLRNRIYDLVLVRRDSGNQLLDEDLNVEMLCDDELVVAAGAHSRWVGRSDIGLAELLAEPWIISPPGYTHAEEVFRGQGLSLPEGRIISLSVTLRMHLMSNGPYVTMFPRSVMRQLAHRFGIVPLAVSLPSKPWPVVVVTLKNRTQSAAVESFLKAAREVARSFSTQPAS
jgi:DNA-binding transcriptional LysR family regulator